MKSGHSVAFRKNPANISKKSQRILVPKKSTSKRSGNTAKSTHQRSENSLKFEKVSLEIWLNWQNINGLTSISFNLTPRVKEVCYSLDNFEESGLKIAEYLAKIGSKIGRAKQIFDMNILVLFHQQKCQK